MSLGLSTIIVSTGSFLLLLYRQDVYQSFMNNYLSVFRELEFETEYPWQWIFPFGASVLTIIGTVSGFITWLISKKSLFDTSSHLPKDASLIISPKLTAYLHSSLWSTVLH